MRVIETHAHLDAPAFAGELDQVLERAHAAGVEKIVSIACATPESASIDRVLEIARQSDAVHVAAGVHPHDAASFTRELGQRLQQVQQDPKVVAWGEIGLDFHYDNSPRDVQLEVFENQLALALECDTPVIIHSREAAPETCSMLERFPGIRGLMHCFTYDWAVARRCLDLGFHLAFGGIVTFPGATALKEVAGKVPADRYVVETDAPYLAPVPRRGKRNEPALVTFVVEELARLRSLDPERVARETMDNSRAFFSLP